MALPLNVFKTVNYVAPTSTVGIYTAPTGYSAVILMAHAANIDSQSHDVTFAQQRTVAGIAVTTELLKNTPIPGNDALNLITGRLVVQTGDTLLLSASDPNNVKVTVSILETLN